MSIGLIRGRVGAVSIEFATVPKGPSGEIEVSVRVGEGKSEKLMVRWRRDVYGLWMETAAGCFGFDITPERDLDGDGTVARTVGLVSRTKGAIELSGLRFVRAGEEAIVGAGASSKKRSVKVRAQMPGKIVRVLVTTGATIKKGQSLLTMEAMKMENEIRAPQDGTITKILVSENQAVESGAELLVLE